ncbi:MAG: PqqD family protein [Mycobacterium sp.]
MKDVTVAVDYEAAASIHENGIVILHTGNGRMYAANETGARIWSGLAQQKPLHTIATEISDEYQVPITSAREHVSAFMDDLEGHSLIRREENL